MEASFIAPAAIAPMPPPLHSAISRIARTGAPSLLHLPAELRKKIYAFALVSESPLMIMSGRLHRHMGDGNADLTTIDHPLVQRHDEVHYDDRPSDLAPVTIPGLDIFLTCRQVYLEATSVFFSRNTFVIIGQYCNSFGPEDRHDCFGTFLAQGADWLQSIGSQITKVPNLFLDINGLCTPYKVGNCIEVLPLLRILWGRRWAGKIEFTASSGLSSQRYPCSKQPINGDPGELLDVPMANKILASLVRDDNFRKYERVLSHVVIRRNGTGGIALFRSTRQSYCRKGATHAYHYINSGWGTYEPCLEHRMDFQLDGNRCKSVPRPLPNLVDLDSHRQRRNTHTHLQRQIFDYVLRHEETQLVDLNVKSKSSAPGLLYVNRLIHNDEIEPYYTQNSFVVKLRIKTNPFQVVDTEELSRWLSATDTRWVPGRVICQGKHNIVSLCLEFEPLDETATSLDDIRIRTRRLVYRGNSEDDYQIVIKIMDASQQQSLADEALVEAKFDLQPLRIEVTRVRRELQGVDIRLGKEDNMDIVINGHGRPVGYVWSDDLLEPPRVHPISLL